MKHPIPKILMVVVLVAASFLLYEARQREHAEETKAASGPVSARSSDEAAGEIQGRAMGHSALMPTPTGNDGVRNNLLVESKYVVAGSLEGDTVMKALDTANFGKTISSFASVSQENPALAARNEAMRRKLADALGQVDDKAVLKEFACTQNLCAAEVQADAGKQSIDYTGFLTDELDREKIGIYTQVSLNEPVGDMTSFRTFFSMGPALRSVRVPSQ